jgi:hypothetical protein
MAGITNIRGKFWKTREFSAAPLSNNEISTWCSNITRLQDHSPTNP